MDPKEKEKQPAMDLPPVESELAIDNVVKQEGSERNPELLPNVQSDDPILQPQTDTAQSASVTQSQATNNQSSNLSTQTPAIADDIDLIEKEWVEKAKEIVEKTKDNPYLQNKAMSEFKADYIKKRYNKELIKSDE